MVAASADRFAGGDAVSALAEPPRDPLAGFDIDTLLAGAARLRPHRPALSGDGWDDPEPLAFGALDRRVSALAAAWAAFDIAPGERILLLADARVAHVAALFGALRARIDVALLPSTSTPHEIARFCKRIDAVAIAAEPADDDGLLPKFAAAALTENVRLVVSLGRRIDGAPSLALDLDEAATPAPARRRAPLARIITADDDGAPVSHTQRTLVAATLDVVTRARIGMRTPILSTLAPTRMAGLACGPIAGLMTGAPIILHGPFIAQRFVDLVEATPGAHLIAPAALLGPLADARLLEPGALSTLLLLHRCADVNDLPHDTRVRAPAQRRAPAIVDIVAVGEEAVLAQPRGARGEPLPLAASPHYLSLDGREVVAVELRQAEQGDERGVRLEGAAVSRGA